MKKIWDFVSNMGYNPLLGHEEVRRIKLLSRLNFITFLVLLLYLLVDLIIGIHTFIPLLITIMFFLAVNLFLLYRKAYRLAKHLSVIIIAACISFFTLFTGEMFSEAFFIPLVAMPLLIFICRKTAVCYLLSLLALVVILKINQASIAPLIIPSKEEIMLFKLLNIVCSAFIAWFLVFYFKAANEEYEYTLVQMNQMVSEKNREITDSIRYAKRIQDSLITSEKYIEKALNKLMDKSKARST